MPNPKVGTVTDDVEKAVTDSKAGKVEYRTDRQAIVHMTIGKASFDEPKLLENYLAVVEEIVRAKPSSAKGKYIRSATLTTSMGPGIRVDTGKAGDSAGSRPAGPVAEEDSSSSQAAGEEPTSTPPADETSEEAPSEEPEADEAQADESAAPAEEPETEASRDDPEAEADSGPAAQDAEDETSKEEEDKE
jgi:hypothetical protein